MVKEKLDHWFRHEYGKMLSIFITKFGADKIDLIEDALHESLYRAMLTWGYKEIPNNPSAWIYKVASNNLIDHFRKKAFQDDIPEIAEELTDPEFSEINDQTLKLIFACCHPKLREQESIILCLKFGAGFGLHEISRVLFITYEAAKKKFQRAKNHFKSYHISLEIPGNKELQSRLNSVLKVIFLIFTEGYRPTEGDQILKEDLCFEALRTALILHSHENLRSSNLCALIALMCFKSARIEARMQGGDEFIRLRDQDRSLWSSELIEEGNRFLAQAFKEHNHSEFHFHAAVESQYIQADTFEKTNWTGLLNIYNYWRKLTKNPSLELNRIVVVMHAQGAEKAYEELKQNCSEKNGYLFFAIKGEVLQQLNRHREATECFLKAKSQTKNKIEKRFFDGRIKFSDL
ncbi:MAG: sigma-70 family RNA polymerase sigma factor [Cytophagales bacterium]|nr:sigma-70 family RNA polymerase sigma factor [Cytophagales bacterium]